MLRKSYLLHGTEIIPDSPEAAAQIKAKTGKEISKELAKKETIAYGILENHNTSGNMDKLKIKFDKLTSHDITFVGIIQTARASGLEKFPIPYVLTNCHNSLCAVGGTINEDDHMFGLTCAKKYGGVYVPPHQAVIHQFAREMLAGGGKMILGSDSHTRYGALGTMAMGEGGPELVKQLLNKTYDIDMPGVGRKTANVVLNVVFGQNTMPVDTHLLRICPKIGLAEGSTPEQVENSLLKNIPAEYLQHAHHWLLLHGRYVCTARNPKCNECLIRDLCLYGRSLKGD